jgi:hypothetical protein
MTTPRAVILWESEGMKEVSRVTLSLPEVIADIFAATWRGVDPAPLLEAVSANHP